MIGKCISVWSYVENEMGTLLGLLLGSQSAAMLDVFLIIRRSSNQREALNVAAQQRLSGDIGLAFEALMILYKSLESQRNDIAHGCYGYSTNLPDRILWIEMKHHVQFMTETIIHERNGVRHTDDTLLKKNLYVYTLSDFEELYKQITALWFAAFHLNCYLRHQHSAIGAQSLQWLYALPQIQREMSRLKEGRETIPSIQQ